MLHNPTKKDDSNIIQSCAEVSDVLGGPFVSEMSMHENIQGVSFPYKSQYIININIV